MTSGIVPRPIAFVSTISEDGIENLAPFSLAFKSKMRFVRRANPQARWFNMVTHNPPTISFSVINNPSNPDGVKDTTHNVKLGHGFTVNIISEPWVELANAACVNSPPKVSEWPISGLTKEPSVCIP